jgi:arsenate reductase
MTYHHDKKRVLFICTHNAARSQMAEGFLRTHYGDRYDAYSAGFEPTRVDPCAITVMREVGVDISKYRSKGLEEFEGQHFDYVVTLCADAQESCPIFIGGESYLHHAFDDPVRVKDVLTEADSCSRFRAVRDQLEAWIDATFGAAK